MVSSNIVKVLRFNACIVRAYSPHVLMPMCDVVVPMEVEEGL